MVRIPYPRVTSPNDCAYESEDNLSKCTRCEDVTECRWISILQMNLCDSCESDMIVRWGDVLQPRK